VRRALFAIVLAAAMLAALPAAVLAQDAGGGQYTDPLGPGGGGGGNGAAGNGQ
jgi:hypothetical protein